MVKSSRRDEDRGERRRAGSGQRDAKHRAGGDWTTIDIPEGIDIFQPKEGSVRLDIVPYEVGEGNPYAKPGELYYERTFFIHRAIGPNNESHVCPAKTAGKPCPICEHRASIARDPDGDENEMKALKPKERQLFLVHVHGKDEEKKVMLFESSFHTFGKLLDKLRQEAEEDEPHKTDFDDPKAGAMLKVGFQETDAGGYSFIEAYVIEFKPRPNGLDPDVLDHGVCLDKLIKVLPYDRLKAIFLQTGDEDSDADDGDEESPKPAKVVKSQVGLMVGDSVRHRKLGECLVKHVSKDGTSLALEDEGGEVHKAVDASEVKSMEKSAKAKAVESDDEEEDEPVVTGKGNAGVKKTVAKGKAAKEEVEEEDDGWDDDGEEEEPTPAKSSVKKSVKPPSDETEDEEDNGWDDGEDEEPAPKKKSGKTVKKDKEDDGWD